MVSEIKHVEKKGKIKNFKLKVVSLFTAAALFVSGGIAILSFNGCSKTNTDSEIVLNVDDLKLTEDFNIDNEQEVKARAQAIYDLSEKEFSVEEIMNMIYVANGRYDLIKFNSNDDAEKFEQIQNLILSYVKLFNDNIFDDIEALSDPSVKPNEDDEIHAYMLIASGEEKAKVIELSEIVNNQLIAIKNQDTSVYEKNAREFYDLYSSIINDKNISDYTRHLVSKYVSQVNSLFIPFLTQEETDELNKNDNLSNSVGSDIVDKVGIDTQKVLDKVGEDCGKKVTPNGKSYSTSDAAKAKTIIPAGSSSEKKVVENGGEKVKTETKKSEPTTKKVVVTEVQEVEKKTVNEIEEDVKESVTSEDVSIWVEQVEDDGYDIFVVEKGGEEVGTTSVTFVDADKDAEKSEDNEVSNTLGKK